MFTRSASRLPAAASAVGHAPWWRLGVEVRRSFIYGYPKNERANITDRELEALRLLAKELLGYNEQQLLIAVRTGELFEVRDDGKA